ncbi:hypothetical protein [Comamonas thiooxydans]|uniref:hypothetical protein n=1 Tax=Comamonas thiooxydans TaxID=363952 RepID=UPI0011867726|nr:hypothetical protein [Comamonas thiooxydans]
MKAYSPQTSKGRHVAGHDVHHKTADMPKPGAIATAKRLRKSARQEGRRAALTGLDEADPVHLGPGQDHSASQD